ncbi:MAG: ribosomal protein S18-alanine N-acetyltransferase [bacterium]
MADAPADRLTYREMSLTDLDQVLEIENRAYQFPWTRGIFMDCFRAHNTCRVACLDGRIVGHAVLMVVAGEATLLNVCIQRDVQGNGFGRLFMHHLIHLAGILGAQTMVLEVRPSNKTAIALYLSLGFVQVGVRKDYYQGVQGREDAHVMALDCGGVHS